MSFSHHFLGPFSSNIRQFVHLALPKGCIELGFADIYGGILGLSWVERSDFWSITTPASEWERVTRKSQKAFKRGSRIVHTSCVWGQGPYPDRYTITLTDSALSYETEIRFCPGSEKLTGWYATYERL